MRHAPVLPIPGRGDYRVRPVFVEDLAALAVAHGALEDNVAVAAGSGLPEPLLSSGLLTTRSGFAPKPKNGRDG
ncbi:MAG TPA: hypothetical protein VI796_04510, partial [Candidatus Thermoplasmatota archaeon]|nr:hypothetical protein [Candidatus Thermoplasmatota archaeon]